MENSTVKEKRPILDPSGQVKSWLSAGRGLQVWENVEIGVSRKELFTPADRGTDVKPHWAYRPGEVLGPDDVLFYEPFKLWDKHWSDTAAGYKAACTFIERLDDYHRPAPVGTVHGTFTVERFALTVHKCSGYSDYQPERSDGVALLVDHRVGILEWTCIEKASQ